MIEDWMTFDVHHLNPSPIFAYQDGLGEAGERSLFERHLRNLSWFVDLYACRLTEKAMGPLSKY